MRSDSFTRASHRALSIGLVLLLATLLGAGCFRGRPSDKPPIHIVPNMDNQPKYEAQEESQFFTDGATMRTPVPGTVARGELRVSDSLFLGKDAQGKLIKTSPVPVTMALLLRGQERFNIYCSPCHGRVGDGRSIMIKHDYLPPPTFHSDRLRQIEDGYIFDVISNGIRNMPSYRQQIPVADRWAIVAYLRALQRSQNATAEDLPEDIRDQMR